VLFLTTNRVEIFDPAFTSRIHVALHYRILRDEDRLRVWANSFERLERESAGKIYIPISARQYIFKSDEVQALRWNGREIRNALQTAVSLAETEALEKNTEKVQLSDMHLRAVVNMSKDFKTFLYRHAGRVEDDDEGDDSSDDDASSILSD
jgi:AAA+ superfamily predicted ATPase